MVKRYDLAERTGYALGPGSMVQDELGDYVLTSDFDRMRRRLVVKLLRERIMHIQHRLGLKKSARRAAWFAWASVTIERGEPLEYFRKLGSEK